MTLLIGTSLSVVGSMDDYVTNFLDIDEVKNLNDGVGCFNDEIDQQQTNLDSWDCWYQEDLHYYQTFKPTKKILTRVKLLLRRSGTFSYVTFRIAIFENTLLAEVTKFAHEIPEDMTWVEFDFDDIYVEPRDDYMLGLQCDGSQGNEICWGFARNDLYPNGYILWWDGYRWWDFQDEDYCFMIYGTDNSPPNKPDQASGTTSPRIGREYTWSSRTIDPDGDQIFYKFKWGDHTESLWLGPYTSGETVFAKHTYLEVGNFNIFVIAQDLYGAESEMSDGITIHPTRTKTINTLFLSFLERFFQCFPILDKILNQII